MQKIFKFFVLATFVLSGCGGPVRDSNEERRLMLIYTDWSESIAMANVSALLLEERLGYEVITKLTEIDTAFKEIAAGNSDLFPDAWVPHTHEVYLKKYRDYIEDLGINYKEARTGLAVPAYAEIESIDDIRYSYRRPIAGIDIAAGIMDAASRAIDMYNLDNELLVLSDSEMSEMVESAVKRRETIVFTGWEPHWLFYRYEFKYLADPLEVFPEPEQIHTISRLGFRHDHPDAATFFERMVFTENQINELLYEITISRDPREGARSWIKNNEFVVNRWVRGLRPEREKIM